MTPAINAARRARISYRIHEYAHDAATASFGREAAEKLGVDPARVFKTLVCEIDNSKLAVGIVPVSATLDLKAFATAVHSKRAAMADLSAAERATGYVAGGMSPLGQKKLLPTVLDRSASSFTTSYVSAGRRGLEIELDPADLLRIAPAALADIARAD